MSNGFRDILILARLSQIGQVSASRCARTPLTGTIGAVHVASLEEGRRWFLQHQAEAHPTGHAALHVARRSSQGRP